MSERTFDVSPRPHVIRPERPADHAALDRLLRAAFAGGDEAALVSDLRGRPDALTLVAEQDGELVGVITFSALHSPTAPPGWRGAGLAPMAVRPDRQRQGIGSALVRAGLDACRQHGIGLVVVLGHAGYYPRFGFRPARHIGLRCRWSQDDDHFMYLELVPGQAALAGAAVEYAAEFDRFG